MKPSLEQKRLVAEVLTKRQELLSLLKGDSQGINLREIKTVLRVIVKLLVDLEIPEGHVQPLRALLKVKARDQRKVFKQRVLLETVLYESELVDHSDI